MQTTLTLAGYTGALLLLLGYALVSTGRWKPRSHIFQATNIIGAGLLVVYSISIEAYPNVILNGVWFLVGLAAAAHIGRCRR